MLWAAEGSKLLEVGAFEYMIYFYGQKREELHFAWSVRITQLIMSVGYTVLCNLTEVSLWIIYCSAFGCIVTWAAAENYCSRDEENMALG